MRQFHQPTLDFLRGRKSDYRAVFGTPAGNRVLRDLIGFCRGTKSCYHDDPRLHAVLEGRREVFLRIANHMNLSVEQLYDLQGGAQVFSEDNPEDQSPSQDLPGLRDINPPK